jgi:hypothetical protein
VHRFYLGFCHEYGAVNLPEAGLVDCLSLGVGSRGKAISAEVL